MTTPDEFLNIDTPENVVLATKWWALALAFGGADRHHHHWAAAAGGQCHFDFGAAGRFQHAGIDQRVLIALLSLISFAFFWGYYIFLKCSGTAVRRASDRWVSALFGGWYADYAGGVGDSQFGAAGGFCRARMGWGW